MNGQAPKRGGLFAASPMEKMLTQLVENRLADQKVNVWEGCLSDELAWDFYGEIKFLNDCTKEELLHVCKVLVKKIQPSDPDKCSIRYVE